MTKEYIERVILSSIKEVTGRAVEDKNEMLIGTKLNIFPADFLYIFEQVERNIGKSIATILENNTFEIMTVTNLTEAIYALD